jgi:PRTRC genetic system ThiF family protein
MKRHYTAQYLIDPTHPITVTLIGVGGNGTQALHDLGKIHYSLVALGHPGLHVYAIDDDTVEVPNIGRQAFSEADLGQYKCVTMITRLNRFYGTDWQAIPERFNKHKWKGSNIVITCVDNVRTRKEIFGLFGAQSKEDYLNEYYWLDFGNAKDFGQFVLGSGAIEQPSSDHDTTRYLKSVIELFPDMENNEDIDQPSCSTREALLKQDLFINPILVNSGMNLLWNLFTQFYIEHHGGFVNLKTMTTKPIKL